MSLYYLGNSRGAEQLNEMRRLEAEGKCLFCPEHLDTAPTQRVLMRTAGWSVTENRYPYRGARLHLLVIPALHVSDILSLPSDVLADFWVALAWIRETYSLEFYGLGARCGDCRYTGGTIQHLHVHVVVGDIENPNHEPVRLKLSSRPAM
jgi:diadenosine tetraphosphate (Ap4A) HIT family hydrolase